jgi:hypothetical protein
MKECKVPAFTAAQVIQYAGLIVLLALLLVARAKRLHSVGVIFGITFATGTFLVSTGLAYAKQVGSVPILGYIPYEIVRSLAFGVFLGPFVVGVYAVPGLLVDRKKPDFWAATSVAHPAQ